MVTHRPLFNVIVLVQRDIQKLVQHPKILRDQLIIELPRLQAFRTREIATLRWELVNEDDRWIYVENSKKDHLFPLPLQWQLAPLLKQFRQEMGQPKNGWVIRPLPTVNVKKSALGKPISNTAIEGVVKEYAREAGIFNWKSYTPTLLRAYFAAEWFRQKRNLKMLQTMMRHNELPTTMHYVSRIVFWEDLEAEFDRIQRIPTIRSVKKSELTKTLDNPMASTCLKCPARFVCKHIDEAMESEWAESCRFYPKIVEEMLMLRKNVMDAQTT